MKNLYFKVFVLLLVSINTYSQVPSYVPTNGLVGWWPFNGNANDESGNTYNGVVNGPVLTSNRNGLLNSAYLFNGSGNITLNGTSNYSFTNKIFSFSFWVCFTANVSNNEGILGKSGPFEYNFTKINDLGYPPNTFLPYISSNKNVCDAYWGQYSGSFPLMGINTWEFYVVTADGIDERIYKNGQLVMTIPNNNCSSDNYLGSNFSLGQAKSYFMNGKLDDIGIWNRALTQQEITDLFNSQTCANPIATITPQGNTTFCQGGSVILNASTGTNYTFEWYKNGQIINGATTGVYQATTSGNYTVKVIDGACNTTSSAITVTVNANPSVTLNSISTYSLKTNVPIQLVGNPNGGTYSGEAVSGSIFTPANATLGRKTISYNYTSQQGCSGSASQTTIVADTVGNVCSTYDTLRIKVKFTAGLYANTTNTVKFYPNPTNDILFIDNGNYQAMSGYTIKIVSLTGAIIYNQPITSQQVQISMNQFATKGLYYAQIFDLNNQLVDAKKIVLE